MLVARSFSYHNRQPQKTVDKASPSKEKRRSEKDGVRGFGWRPPSFDKFAQEVDVSKVAAKEPRAAKMSEKHNDEETRASGATTPIATPKHSEPVAVPTKKKSVGEHHARRANRLSVDEKHDPKAPSPSVAALLAMTSIPKKKRFPRQNEIRSIPRKMSSSELVEEWRQMEAEEKRLGSSPTMDVLLSPPDGQTMLSRTLSDEESRSLEMRSASSESMPSLALSSDIEECSVYSVSSPSTPEMLAKRPGRRKDKSKSLVASTSAECALDDHPLVGASDLEDNWSPPTPPSSDASLTQRNNSHFQPAKTSTTSRPTFRSNLTASLSAFRNAAARSFSNFAVPTTLPDDHLTRGLFGTSPYPPEMRPKAFVGSPTPELRRYLNPTGHLPPQHHLPPTDFHLHNSHLDHTDLEAAAAASARLPREHARVIALQPFAAVSDSAARPTSDADARRATAHLVAGKKLAPATNAAPTEASRALPQRHREPRENGEFLRVFVAEMNMRRAGKLEDGGGRARFWLPPRAVEAPVKEATRSGKGEVDGKEGGEEVERRVPRRWRGVSV